MGPSERRPLDSLPQSSTLEVLQPDSGVDLLEVGGIFSQDEAFTVQGVSVADRDVVDAVHGSVRQGRPHVPFPDVGAVPEVPLPRHEQVVVLTQGHDRVRDLRAGRVLLRKVPPVAEPFELGRQGGVVAVRWDPGVGQHVKDATRRECLCS